MRGRGGKTAGDVVDSLEDGKSGVTGDEVGEGEEVRGENSAVVAVAEVSEDGSGRVW